MTPNVSHHEWLDILFESTIEQTTVTMPPSTKTITATKKRTSSLRELLQHSQSSTMATLLNITKTRCERPLMISAGLLLFFSVSAQEMDLSRSRLPKQLDETQKA